MLLAKPQALPASLWWMAVYLPEFRSVLTRTGGPTVGTDEKVNSHWGPSSRRSHRKSMLVQYSAPSRRARHRPRSYHRALPPLMTGAVVARCLPTAGSIADGKLRLMAVRGNPVRRSNENLAGPVACWERVVEANSRVEELRRCAPRDVSRRAPRHDVWR